MRRKCQPIQKTHQISEMKMFDNTKTHQIIWDENARQYKIVSNIWDANVRQNMATQWGK
jgi:hypothetical protein